MGASLLALAKSIYYIMVHDYGLTWLSMLFHVLPCHG